MFPGFMQDSKNVQSQKKMIISMLSDSKFMDAFLSRYDMLVTDFFAFIYRIEPDIFKGSFLKKIYNAMKYKKYAIKAKKATYHERKKARLREIKKAKLKSS